MSNEDSPQTKSSEFLDDPTPTGGQKIVFDTSFEAILVKDALEERLEKLKDEPLTEYRDQRIAAYHNEIRVINAWMFGPDTPAPELNATIFEELDIENLLGEESNLSLRMKEEANKDQPVEQTAPSSPKNYFHPSASGTGVDIGFQGEKATYGPIRRSLKDIAFLLRHPHQPRKFVSTVQFDENTNGAMESDSDCPTINPSLDVNQILDPKFKHSVQEKARDLAERLRDNTLSLNSVGEDLDNTQADFDKLREFLRKGCNAQLKDNGTIKWGPLRDKNLVSKQKDAVKKNIKNGISFLKNNGMPKFANHLTQFLLPKKKYCPPDGMEEFDITI